MIPHTEIRKPRNSTKVNMIFSFVFHAVIALTVTYFAARQGLIGKQLQKIAVEMVKEKKIEKPKEPEKPKTETAKLDAPKIAEIAKVPEVKQTQQAPPSSAVEAPPMAAPPAVEVAAFDFEGGHTVESISDPVQVYKGILEYSLKTRWERPEDIDDHALVALIKVSVDAAGRVSNPVWVSGSGNKKWDDSVRRAIAAAKPVGQAPPTNFPSTVEVRFDVVQSETVALQ